MPLTHCERSAWCIVTLSNGVQQAPELLGMDRTRVELEDVLQDLAILGITGIQDPLRDVVRDAV
jgi:magnesium-transporting ATPase (P-type)